MPKSSIEKTIAALPSDPGVYIFQNKKGTPLYIGKATHIKERVRSHFYEPEASNPQKSALLSETATIVPYTTPSEIEALILESRLIKSLKPRYNVTLRDDKQYFYVGFTNDTFPRIFLTHQPFKKIRNPKHETRNKSKILNSNDPNVSDFGFRVSDFSYIGPFTDGTSLKQTLKLLRRIFPYCTCKKPHNQFCLNYHMGKDAGYCCGQSSKFKVQSEKLQFKSQNVKEYKSNIHQIQKILEGQGTKVIREIEKEMNATAKAQKFERATVLRNQWEGLQNIFAHRHVIRTERQRHVVPDFEQSEKQGTPYIHHSPFNIREMHRIEGYDISNIQGNWAVGSMVVFSQNAEGQFGPQKNAYRKFRIKTVRGANDPAMMREVLQRRLAHTEWPFPDLIVVDGGQTQRNAALQAMNEAKVSLPLVGLAKREEELYTEKGRFLLSSLPSHCELLFRHLRDEAHRFAIGYYRKLHRKSFKL